MFNISDLKDTQRGTGLVIANGPSLNDIPVSFLNKYPSFGTNRIYLLGNFYPTYYVCTNQNVIDQSLEEIFAIDCEVKFLPENVLLAQKTVCKFKKIQSPRFSTNLTKGLNEGYTVTHVCLQLAYWLGFEQILIVGLDHYYKDQGQANRRVKKRESDTDHFSPNYFPPGTIWQYPDIEQSEISYRAARVTYALNGRKIINISTKTACTIFPVKSWTEF